MSLTIKNKDVYNLASELATLTGTSMTKVVLDALRSHREQILRKQQNTMHVQELTSIAQRCAAHIQHPPLAVEHGDMLYDDNGMPK